MALYDPRQFPTDAPKVVSPDFTVADVLAWARTKPRDEGYNFCDPNNCAIAQFGKATGRPYLVGIGSLRAALPSLGPAMQAIVLSTTFGELVRGLHRVVEPNPLLRLWARLSA